MLRAEPVSTGTQFDWLMVVLLDDPALSVMFDVVVEPPETDAAWLLPAPQVCVTAVSFVDPALCAAPTAVWACVLLAAD